MNSEERNDEPAEADGFAVRGANNESVSRLKEAVRQAGGNRAVARRSGIPLSTLNSALAGTSDPRASAVAAIAAATGTSLDWIYFGRQSGRAATAPLDIASLTAAIALVEEWLALNKRKMEPQKKAQIVGQIYQFVIEDRELGKEPIDSHRVAQFLRLVA